MKKKPYGGLFPDTKITIALRNDIKSRVPGLSCPLPPQTRTCYDGLARCERLCWVKTYISPRWHLCFSNTNEKEKWGK